MENQITEFIGLACFKASQDFNTNSIPQGVIEKMLVLGHRLGLPLENLETRIFKRGETVVWRRPTLVVEPKNIDLKLLTSRYFIKTSSDKGTIFQLTEDFSTAFRQQLCKKDYFVNYEGFITDCLRVWELPGGLDNLLFLTLAGEFGVQALSADLELMFDVIYEYVRTQIYLPIRKRQKDPLQALREVKEIKSALDKKLNLLRSYEKYLNQIESLPFSVNTTRLLEQSKYFPNDCLLWDVIEWLASIVSNVAEKVLERPGPSSSRRSELINSLEQIVQNISQATYQNPMVSFNSQDEQLVTLIKVLHDSLFAWIRAILGHYDSRYFADHRLDSKVKMIQNVIVSYDVKRSTKILDNLLRVNKSEGGLLKDLSRWRRKLYAIPSNWSILFDGVLKSEGDQVIGFFDQRNKALASMAITLVHIDLLESVNLHQERFRFGLKAGIGSGTVCVVGTQEMSPAINYVYHAIDEICKFSPIKDWKSSALILDDFYKNHPDLKPFCSQTFEFEDGKAHLFDYQAWTKEWLKRLK